MQRIVEYLHFCWHLTLTSFLKIYQLVKTFQIMHNSFGVINILVYGGWELNFNICPNMVKKVKEHAKRIFYIFELLSYKKQSKYCFRQLVHKDLQYRIFAPALSLLSLSASLQLFLSASRNWQRKLVYINHSGFRSPSVNFHSVGVAMPEQQKFERFP